MPDTATRFRRRFRQPYTIVDPEKPCPGCGYSLAGLEQAVARCPECGRELSADDLAAEYRFLPIWMSVRDVCALPGIAAVVMLLGGLAAVLIDEGVAGVVMFIAGACWLVSGGVMAIYLLAEATRTTELRRGRQRAEHLVRLGYCFAGLLVVLIVPIMLLLLAAMVR